MTASQYALDRLFLTHSNSMPLKEVLSFSNETAVADFFGVGIEEANLATDYFRRYVGSSAQMLFARFPVGGGRAYICREHQRTHAG
jgi:hypothetical protein